MWGGPRQRAGHGTFCFCGVLYHRVKAGLHEYPQCDTSVPAAHGLRSLKAAAKAGLCKGQVF